MSRYECFPHAALYNESIDISNLDNYLLNNALMPLKTVVVMIYHSYQSIKIIIRPDLNYF